MPLLGRSRRRRREVADLLTATVTQTGDGWLVLWWSDGAVPEKLTAPSLTEAAAQAASATAARYSASQSIPGAELQLAIYPWEYGQGAPIFDISGGPSRFAARDIQGSDFVVEGASLKDLVTLVEQMPDGTTSMFRWVRPITALPTQV